MSWLHALGRNTHIVMGTLGLLAGALAMMLRKGSPMHARVGHVFFVSMTLMASTGTILSIVPELDRLNIAGGSLALYLTITAWITVVQRIKYVYDETRPPASDPDEDTTTYQLWDRPSRRDTTARAALKGE